MRYTLINARPSPFGRKVAIAMLEKGIAFDVEFDLPWGDQTRTPLYSPVEQLPILITDTDERVFDSAYILDWLETKFPNPALLPSDPDARLEVRKRRMLGERLMEFAQALIFELHRADPSSAWVDRQTRKVHGATAELDRLYAGRVANPGFALDQGDIAVATTLLGIEFAVASGLSPNVPVLSWRDRCTSLAAMASSLSARPSFISTEPGMMDVDLQAAVA